MSISNVELKNNQYQVYDGSSKKIKEIHSSNGGELKGFGNDFMVFSKNNYFATYDESFKKLNETHSSNVGDFKNASGSTIIFVKNNYIGTYDDTFKKISERHVQLTPWCSWMVSYYK